MYRTLHLGGLLSHSIGGVRSLFSTNRVENNIKSVDSDISNGWIGIIQNRNRRVLLNYHNRSKVEVIPFDIRTINPLTLCRIGWDLELRSPGGYSSDSSDPELGFSLYLEDIIEQQTHGVEELLESIWEKLKKTNSVIDTM